MGTQKPVVIGEEITEENLGGPIAQHHGKKKKKGKSQQEKVEEKIKEEKFGKDKQDNQDKQEIKTETAESEEKKEAEEKPKKTKVGKAKVRSKKYQEAYKLIDHTKKYAIGESLDLVKKTSWTKFDGNCEVHMRLLGKSAKPESVRGLLKYPHSTGKTVKAVIIDEKIAAEIEKTKKADADIYIATPEMMPKIAKLAKILGPKGKMPNPKNGTIAKDPQKAVADLSGGQVEYKTDKFGNLHQIIGKVSADNKNLEENFKALLSVVPTEKIVTLSLCATMGPAIKVQI